MGHLFPSIKIIIVLSLTAIVISHQTLWSHDLKKNAIEISNPFINKPFAGANSAAGYLIIRNKYDKEFNLLQVSTTLGRAMLHKTTTTEEGVVKMEHLMKVNIPAGDELIMQPGGVHVMIMGISRPLIVGEKIPAKLNFSNDLEMDIEFTVQEHKKHSDVQTQSKHEH